MSARSVGALAALALAAVVAAPAGGGSALAAQAGGEPLVLTLEEAQRIAALHNPAYQRALNSLALNPTETRNTWLNTVLPRTNLTLFNTGYNGNLQRIGTDDFGNPRQNPEAEWAYFSNTSQSLNLSWTLQGNNLVNAIETQRETNSGRALAEDAALADARNAVRRQYYEVQEQREILEMERALDDDRRLDLELVERLFSLADRTRVDVLNAELAIEQQGLAILQQAATYEQARLALRTVLGDPELPDFRLAEEPVPVFDPSTLDADALVRQAQGVNPTVRQVESSERVAALGLKEQKNRWWPNLDLRYTVARRAQTRQGEALFDLSWNEDLDNFFSISLSLPFFNNYFESSANVQRAAVELDNARESAREARLQVEEQVRAAVSTLKNGWESLRLAERSLEIAGEALELAREEYRLGARTFEQLREGVRQEADARRQVIEARYRFMDALIGLEEAVGAPVRVPAVTEQAGG